MDKLLIEEIDGLIHEEVIKKSREDFLDILTGDFDIDISCLLDLLYERAKDDKTDLEGGPKRGIDFLIFYLFAELCYKGKVKMSAVREDKKDERMLYEYVHDNKINFSAPPPSPDEDWGDDFVLTLIEEESCEQS